MPLSVVENQVTATIEIRGTRNSAGSTLAIFYTDPYLNRLGIAPQLLPNVTLAGTNWTALVPASCDHPRFVVLILVEVQGGVPTVAAKRVELTPNC